MRKFEQIGRKPAGILGIAAGRLMNTVHDKQYSKIICSVMSTFPNVPSSVLDVGCGGGGVLRIISEVLPEARLRGVDHSADMVNLASRINRRNIAAGRIAIAVAGVECLPFSDKFFDLVTIFDTISFWQDHDAAFKELKRVLAPGGSILLINGYPAEGTKWYDFVKFKNDTEYQEFLRAQGFFNIRTKIEKKTIVISAVLV